MPFLNYDYSAEFAFKGRSGLHFSGEVIYAASSQGDIRGWQIIAFKTTDEVGETILESKLGNREWPKLGMPKLLASTYQKEIESAIQSAIESELSMGGSLHVD